MMTGGLRIETRPMLHRAALGIGRAVVKPPDAGKRDRRHAHGAGLERHIEVAIGQPLGAERFAGGADREQFGVGGRVPVRQGAVAGFGDHRAVADDHAADRDFALPGGLGTLEELAEISTWAQLGQHAKPIVLCNIEGYWDPLITLFAHMREERFIREGLEFGMETVTRAEDVVPAFEYRIRTGPKPIANEPLLGRL